MPTRILRMSSFAIAAALATSLAALAQTASDCQSPWGSDDQRGAMNRLTPAKPCEAGVVRYRGRT